MECAGRDLTGEDCEQETDLEGTGVGRRGNEDSLVHKVLHRRHGSDQAM